VWVEPRASIVIRERPESALPRRCGAFRRRTEVQPCAIGGRINSTGSAEGLSEFVVPAQERVKESYGHSFSRHPGESRGPSRGSTNLAGSLTHCHCLKTSEWR